VCLNLSWPFSDLIGDVVGNAVILAAVVWEFDCRLCNTLDISTRGSTGGRVYSYLLLISISLLLRYFCCLTGVC
jgi:hypothetical protein